MNIFYKAINLAFSLWSHLHRLLSELWSITSSVAPQFKRIFSRITMAEE